MKNKKMSTSIESANCQMGNCSHAACQMGKGKALANVAIGLLLIMFMFHYIPTIEMLAGIIGVVFILKGGVKLLKKC